MNLDEEEGEIIEDHRVSVEGKKEGDWRRKEGNLVSARFTESSAQKEKNED